MIGHVFAMLLAQLAAAPVTRTDLVIAGIMIVGASALIQWLARRSLEQNYQERLDRYKAELRRRDESVNIAQLLTYAARPDSVDSQTLNQLAWEMYLWLPAGIAADLTAALKAENQDPRDILIQVRRHLHGKGDPLTRDQIPRW
jgi:hypothetical protein